MAAVDGIDLEVQPGEFLSLLGPTGCGKTTTLRLIAGFERPDEGDVRIGGSDVSRVPPYKRDVNTVFQSYALFPHLTVEDNVAYGLKQRGLGRTERRRERLEMLELVRLEGLEARKPRELSGGQQQRVALARALVMSPRVLLLDEPLGALDLKVRKELQIELKRIQEEIGITFVYVTHDQEEALAMSDRVVVMNGGRIEQIGAPHEIYDTPATEWIAGFIGDTNFIRVNGQRGRGAARSGFESARRRRGSGQRGDDDGHRAGGAVLRPARRRSGGAVRGAAVWSARGDRGARGGRARVGLLGRRRGPRLDEGGNE